MLVFIVDVRSEPDEEKQTKTSAERRQQRESGNVKCGGVEEAALHGERSFLLLGCAAFHIRPFSPSDTRADVIFQQLCMETDRAKYNCENPGETQTAKNLIKKTSENRRGFCRSL